MTHSGWNQESYGWEDFGGKMKLAVSNFTVTQTMMSFRINMNKHFREQTAQETAPFLDRA